MYAVRTLDVDDLLPVEVEHVPAFALRSLPRPIVAPMDVRSHFLGRLHEVFASGNAAGGPQAPHAPASGYSVGAGNAS